MWLLDTTNLTIHEFYNDFPPYVILSHRWEEEEISFQTLSAHPTHLKGYRKVKRFCSEARQNGYKYGWVDTCCIDKKSSAELSEAINSMFTWYANADACYAFLSDVHESGSFIKSQWFTRGWTLQELLAPRRLDFYNADWSSLGSRDELSTQIENTTGIPQDAATPKGLSRYHVAHKMSWASRRRTTRLEDMAYCLLGLFDINMPLLYGEGDRAFQRLQEEIMKINTDMSLFAWQGAPCPRFSMLASSPHCFAPSSHFLGRDDGWSFSGPTQGFALNNAGMTLETVVFPSFKMNRSPQNDAREIWIMLLAMRRISPETPAIYLERCQDDNKNEYFRRVSIDRSQSILLHQNNHSKFLSFEPRQIFIKREVPPDFSTYKLSDGFLKLYTSSSLSVHARQNTAMDRYLDLEQWESSPRESISRSEAPYSFIFPYRNTKTMVGFTGSLTINIVDDIALLLAFGLDNEFRFVCIAVFPCSRAFRKKLDSEALTRAFLRLSGSDDPEESVRNTGVRCMIFTTKGYQIKKAPLINTLGLTIEPALEWSEAQMYTYCIILNEAELVRQSLHLVDNDFERFRSDRVSAMSKLLAVEKATWDARVGLFFPSGPRSLQVWKHKTTSVKTLES